MSKVSMGDSYSQPFTTTCAISSTLKEHQSWRKAHCKGDPSISCCKMRDLYCIGAAQRSEQLVRFYRPAVRECTLMVIANSIQQQEGSIDCGVFSVAATYSLVYRYYKVPSNSSEAWLSGWLDRVSGNGCISFSESSCAFIPWLCSVKCHPRWQISLLCSLMVYPFLPAVEVVVNCLEVDFHESPKL